MQSSLNSLIVGFDPAAANPIQRQVTGITTNGVIEYAGQNGYGNTATHPNADKFSPRFGFAWSMSPKTTIRGGYGLLWAPYTFSLFTPLGYTYSTPYVASNDGNVTPANSLSNPFPNGHPAACGQWRRTGRRTRRAIVLALDPHAHSTRIHQYSLDIQRDLGQGFVLALGYTGRSRIT